MMMTAEPEAGRLALVRDPLRLLMFVLTIVTVSRIHQHYPVIASMRPALVLVVAAAAYAFAQPRALTRVNVLRVWPMRLVALLALLALASAAFGISLGRAASFILDSYAKTLAFAFLVALSIRGARDLYTVVWGYVASCGILVFFSFFVFGLARPSGSYVTRLNDMYTYDSNDVGVVLLVGAALTLLLLVVSRGFKRWLLLLNLVLIAATIARSGSRGAFLGVLVLGAAGLLIANNIPATRRLVIAALAAGALAIGAPAGYWDEMATIMNPTADYNYSALNGRKALVERGIGYMRAYPVFGLGINNFSRAECTISSKIGLVLNGPLRCTPPHNSFLQAGTEIGIPGLLVFLALVGGGVVKVLRLRRRLPASWRYGSEVRRFLYAATTFLPLAMIGFAVPALFVSFAWLDPVYLLAALITGLYVSVDAELREGAAGVSLPAAGRRAGWRTAPLPLPAPMTPSAARLPREGA